MTAAGLFLFGASLCADCFAVTLCSSLSLSRIRPRDIARVATAFAFVQTGFLLLGWGFGSLLAGLIERISHLIGFLLLAYVGGSMVLDGARGKTESRNLSGWKNVILGGVATSIDALAVGISMSMGGDLWAEILPKSVSVFVCTALSVIVGMLGARVIAAKTGRIAEIVGGTVLILIGVNILKIF